MNDFFKSLITPKGRIGRLRYFLMVLFLGLAGLFLGLFEGLFGTLLFYYEGAGLVALAVLAFLGTLALMVVSFFLVAQRLHDLGQSGWVAVFFFIFIFVFTLLSVSLFFSFGLLLLVSLASIVFALILLFKPGQKHENRYGPPPALYQWTRAPAASESSQESP